MEEVYNIFAIYLPCNKIHGTQIFGFQFIGFIYMSSHYISSQGLCYREVHKISFHCKCFTMHTSQTATYLIYYTFSCLVSVLLNPGISHNFVYI